MGEYEPNDSRNVTLKPSTLPGEPPRTGPREAETRYQPDPQGEQQPEEGERGDRADEPEHSSIGQARGGPLDLEGSDPDGQEQAARERGAQGQAGERGSGSLEDSRRQQTSGFRD